VFTIVNEVFVILQHVPPLCDCKGWIDTVSGSKAISYLGLMAQLNMMEDEFYAHRMEERRRAAYFAMHHEMDREQDKEKQEEERAQKREKAHRAKETFPRGGDKTLMKGKWSCLTQN
jgi:hypothetical protein